MFLSDKTVKNYVSSILSKLNLQRRAQAAAYVAKRRGQRALRQAGVRPLPAPSASVDGASSLQNASWAAWKIA